MKITNHMVFLFDVEFLMKLTLPIYSLLPSFNVFPPQAVSAEAVSPVGGAYLTSYVTTVSTEVKVHLACVVMGKVMAVTGTCGGRGGGGEGWEE